MEDIGKQLVMYAKFGSKYISVYNPFLKCWEVKMTFRNERDRDKYFEYIEPENRSHLKEEF